MDIQSLNLKKLHNAEHFEFHADILVIVPETNPVTTTFTVSILRSQQ